MVLIRRLSVEEKLERVRDRYDARAARHNAGIVERLDLGPKPGLRDQVLEEFSPLTRRWARADSR
jgi:hypothetical protein